MGMESRKNHKTADVSQVLGAASTASLDVQKAQCEVVSYHSWFMCQVGMGPLQVPWVLMWDAHVCACVSTYVPSDALEQMLHSARGLRANQTCRADISNCCFLGTIHINYLECSA